MKKVIYLVTLLMLSAFSAMADTASLTFADAGLAAGSMVDLSPVAMGSDIKLVFEQGTAFQPPKITSTGRVTLPQGSILKIIGTSNKIKITKVILTSRRKSSMFSAGSASCTPEGTFTLDETAFTGTYEPKQSAEAVQITPTVGAPEIIAISVTYTGGSGGGTDPDNPDNPDDPDDPVSDNTFTVSFNTPEEFASMSVINVADDSNTWRYDRNGKYVSIRNDMGNTVPKDDYLVTPALSLKAGHFYRLDFKAWCDNPDYEEKIGAYIGTSPEASALTRVIVPETVVDNTVPRLYSNRFTVEADGTYYIAVHASSAPGMFMLYVDDIEVSRAVNGDAPAEIDDYSVVPETTGQLSATISLTAPSVTMSGGTLTDITSVVIKRDGNDLTTLSSRPGEPVSFTDTSIAENGFYTYTATVENSQGKGFDSKATVYVGMAAPSNPVMLGVEEPTYGTLHFEWQPVTSNIYGHEIAPSAVSYIITDSENNIVADNLSGNSATIEYVALNDPQRITAFTLKAVTAAGMSAKGASTGIVAVGSPFSMPFAENFPGALLTENQEAEIIADPVHAVVRWGFFEGMVLHDIYPVTPDGGMMSMVTLTTGDSSVFRTGKIHIDADAANPYLSLFYYAVPEAADNFTVAVNDDELLKVVIGQDTRGWHEVLVPLSSYRGADVRVAITGVCAAHEIPICIDNISVKNEPELDMEISRARIPYEMIQSNVHRCNIRVTNLGVSPSGDYIVTLLKNGEDLYSSEGTSLERGESKDFTFDITCGDGPGETNVYKVELNVGGDENPDNNSVTVTSKVADAYLPVPEGLTAVKEAGDSFRIEWNAVDPDDLPARTVTESFEAYDEFEINKAGEWAFNDGDACAVYGIRDGYHSYPNMFAPMAFMVFNNHDGYFPQIGTSSFAPHTGGQCMMSASVDIINSTDRDNDDWLISPRLSGAAQNISFYARSSGMVFPEKFRIMYSVNDRLPSSFTELSTVERVPAEWTRYEADLPEGTTYFAICNISHDAYMFFIDDVSFTAAPVEASLIGYDVFAGDPETSDWRKLNAEPLTTPVMTTADVVQGESVRVRSVFDKGVSALSEPVVTGLSSVTVPGTEDNISEPEYYSTGGIRLSSRPTVPGIYIMRQGSSCRKIVVK